MRTASRRTVGRTSALMLCASLVFAALPHEASARSKSTWTPVSKTRWMVGGGGDAFRTGFNPTETRPAFTSCAPADTACHDQKGPWLEWVTKLSDLPSGIWPEAGITVWDGLIYVAAGATNSFIALDATTGLPVWRFSPDPRADGYTSNYPASNAPVVNNGIVYATFSSGLMVALDGKTGRKIWSYRATEGYTDTDPDRVGTATADAPATSPYREESFLRNRGDFAPVHPGVDYPKIHGAASFCENTAIFMTLSGWVYGINGTSGKLRWKVYADAPDFPGELVWPEFKRGGVQKPQNSAVGMSTRRFEAVPGVGCLHGEVQVPGSDGRIRFLDPQTGKTKAQSGDVGEEFERVYGTTDKCASAGFNCDIAVGLADPSSGDYVITTLDGRTFRLDWRTHEPEWLRSYGVPLPFENAANEFALPPLPQTEDGFLAQAVTGGPKALDPNKRYLYFANQDGHLYVLYLPDEGVDESAQSQSCASGVTNIRPEPVAAADEPKVPCLVARIGLNPNTDEQTQYTRRGEGGPWDYNQHALGGLVLGGDVLYIPTWDNKMNAYDVADPANPRKIWEYEIKWNDDFPYPPFGRTEATPFADIDLKIFSAPALLNGHLYFAANDGSVYSFNLKKKVTPRRNLAILGSGVVPFLPEIQGAIGRYDRVWTPADWYKNQVSPVSGYRLPSSAGIASATTLLLGTALAWWYVRRRDEWGGEEDRR